MEKEGWGMKVYKSILVFHFGPNPALGLGLRFGPSWTKRIKVQTVNSASDEIFDLWRTNLIIKVVSAICNDIYTVRLSRSIIQLPMLDDGEFIPPDASESDHELEFHSCYMAAHFSGLMQWVSYYDVFMFYLFMLCQIFMPSWQSS